MNIACPTRGRPSSPPVCALVLAVVASAYRIARNDLASRSRSAPVARARQAAVYLAHVAFGVSFSAIGRAFGRDRTTIRHACGRIEDARDDRSIDLGLAYLEQASRSLFAAVADQARLLAQPGEQPGG